MFRPKKIRRIKVDAEKVRERLQDPEAQAAYRRDREDLLAGRPPIEERLRRIKAAEKITAKDLNVTINCTGPYQPAPHQSFASRFLDYVKDYSKKIIYGKD